MLEYSLSLDNVFVWALIFSAFSVPDAYQHRVLFYGIFGALVLRGAFVAAGSELLERFEWIVYVFGALLLFSGVRMLRGGREIDHENGAAVRLLRQRVPTTSDNRSARTCSSARDDDPEDDRPDDEPLLGRWYATPMLAVLAVIETSDIIFAVDSIPAIFGVTREPFIVFSRHRARARRPALDVLPPRGRARPLRLPRHRPRDDPRLHRREVHAHRGRARSASRSRSA